MSKYNKMQMFKQRRRQQHFCAGIFYSRILIKTKVCKYNRYIGTIVGGAGANQIQIDAQSTQCVTRNFDCEREKKEIESKQFIENRKDALENRMKFIWDYLPVRDIYLQYIMNT